MGKTYVKGGTPVGSASLCKTCSSAHIMSGYRESELITVCTFVYHDPVIPFPICECTGYHDKNKPTWKQMEDLAITVTPGPLKPVGFKVGIEPPKEVRVGPDPDEDEDDYDED